MWWGVFRRGNHTLAGRLRLRDPSSTKSLVVFASLVSSVPNNLPIEIQLLIISNSGASLGACQDNILCQVQNNCYSLICLRLFVYKQAYLEFIKNFITENKYFCSNLSAICFVCQHIMCLFWPSSLFMVIIYLWIHCYQKNYEIIPKNLFIYVWSSLSFK